MNPAAHPGRPWLFRGWWILAAAFVGEMLAVGSTVYAFGLFVKPVAEEFAASRATINGGLMLFFVGMALTAPVIGRLLDRWPARWIMAVGALAMGAGFVGIALAPTLPLMGLCIALLVAPGSIAVGPLTANTLVTRWFLRHRAKALGIAAVATSIGGAVIVPLVGGALTEYGWRGALLIQGSLIALVVPVVALWLIRDRPQDVGLEMDGQAPAEAGAISAAAAAGRSWSTRELLLDRTFWCVGLAVGLLFSVNQSVLASLVPYATDGGLSVEQATLLVSAASLCSIVGKLAFGVFGDRVDQRYLLIAVAVLIVVQLLAMIATPGFALLLVMCCIGGFAGGVELPLWASLVGARFGSRSFGAVMGLMNPINMIASIVGVRFAGQAFDRSGDYDLAFQVFVGVAALSAAMALLIPVSRSLPRGPTLARDGLVI